MWKENLYQQVEILLRAHDEFPIGAHQHSFFEMTYILEGSGTFCAHTAGDGKEEHAYAEGDLFLVPPNRIHSYHVHTHSRYVFVRFTEKYVRDCIGHYMEHMLDIRSGFCVQFSEAGKEAVKSLANLLAEEVLNRRVMSEQLTLCYVHSLVLWTVRGLPVPEAGMESREEDKAQHLLLYIQQHLHQPEQLRIPVLADKFHLSPTYIGRFFKRNFGEDFRLYVSRSRLKRVEELLAGSRMSVKEIASRMGYIDSCYLNKLFRQHHGMTPMQYRKMYRIENE